MYIEAAKIEPTPIKHKTIYKALAEAIPSATPTAFLPLFLIALFTTNTKSGPGLSNAKKCAIATVKKNAP